MVKFDLEMMFGDVLESCQGHLRHVWDFQISMAAILEFFQVGLAYDFGAKYEISSSLYVVKMDLEMMFGMFETFLQSGYPSIAFLVRPLTLILECEGIILRLDSANALPKAIQRVSSKYQLDSLLLGSRDWWPQVHVP